MLILFAGCTDSSFRMPVTPTSIQTNATQQEVDDDLSSDINKKLYICVPGGVCEFIGDKFCNQENNFCNDDFKLPKFFEDADYDIAKDGCLVNRFANKKDSPANVDLWLIVDSNQSFEEKRKAAAEILAKAYIDELSKKVKVTVSVIPSHTKFSIYSPTKNKNIFYQKADEPRVLHFSPEMKETDRAKLRQVLFDKLSQMPLDRELEDNSEVGFGLYTYIQALTRIDASDLEQESELVTYFISDKRDICSDIKRISTYEEHDWHQTHCPSLSSPYLVRSKANGMIKKLKVKNHRVGGFINASDSNNNRLGFGYNSYISLMGGSSFDFSLIDKDIQVWVDDSYNKKMKKVMDVYYQESNISSGFFIVDGKKAIVDLKLLDKKSFKVFVDGKPVQPYLDYQTNRVRISESGDNISVHYRLK